MSFEPNDMNTIHLGNYEEFFVLYMDNELSEAQVKMVDEFLSAHPDLKTEFEILMSTKLPLEQFSFDKNDLLAGTMKRTLIDEELLLYIDNELPSDKKKTVELEIASNKEFQLQHQLLQQTKLDPSEKIEYPHKKELYRRTERVVLIKMWMRVAAAAVLVAVAGILYFRTNTSKPSVPTAVAQTGVKPAEKQQSTTVVQQAPGVVNPENSKGETAVINSPQREERKQQKKEIEIRQAPAKDQLPVAVKSQADNTDQDIARMKIKDIPFDNDQTIALADPKVSVNKVDVTSSLANRINNSSDDDENNLLASNDHKGSVKGFLRKATRMIEKRTGIDPTNDNGELLIGAVAINLK